MLDVSNVACTPIKVPALSKYLAKYPIRENALELLEGFQFGFKLCYEGPRRPYNCNNLKSLKLLTTEAIQLVNKEINMGRVAGPFPYSPLHNLRLSPIGMVPKKDGTFRLIHHLSHPAGDSVNDYIDHKYCSVRYTPFEEALEMLEKLGSGALMARLDVKSAFRLLPVHPSDFQLLGYKINDYIYIDKCMPFGCSVSCAKFEKFASFLEWVLKTLCQSYNVVHYLDDFLLAGLPGTQECHYLVSKFTSLCDELGVPLAHDKTLGPTTKLVFLGLEIDTVAETVSIPLDKLGQLRHQLNYFLYRKKVTLSEIQSLTGLLNFCIRAIPAGRAFVRRLYDATTGLSKPYHKRRVSLEMKQDIQMWLVFLESFNGINSYKQVDWANDFQLELFTDSAGSENLGCGAIFGTHWAFLTWPESWKGACIFRDITFLELVPIAMAFSIWGKELVGKRVILHTDNKALVTILNTKTSKSPRVMILLRLLVLKGLVHNIQFKGQHIIGVQNVKADSLSRLQWNRFRHVFPEADQLPSTVPDSFLRLIYNIEHKNC